MTTELAPTRRVVTGLDGEGRSCIARDDEAAPVIWSAPTFPADNGGEEDRGGRTFRFPTAGVEFVVTDFPPGRASALHATDTLDFTVVVAGEITFFTETDETVLRAGDVLVDRGMLHGWRNDGAGVCRIATVLCAAKPVAGGATASGQIEF